MDDSFIVGSIEDALVFWETVETYGPDIVYIVNDKSKVYDLDTSNKQFWESVGLTFLIKAFRSSEQILAPILLSNL